MSIQIYTDGTFSDGKIPFGGWAYVILQDEGLREAYGGTREVRKSTESEFLAIIKALSSIDTAEEVTVFCDYVSIANVMNNRLYEREKFKNHPLWSKLVEFNELMNIRWMHVKGHSDNIWNHRCDELSKLGMASVGLFK